MGVNSDGPLRIAFASCRREDAIRGIEDIVVLPLDFRLLFAGKCSQTSVQQKRTVRSIFRKGTCPLAIQESIVRVVAFMRANRGS